MFKEIETCLFTHKNNFFREPIRIVVSLTLLQIQTIMKMIP